MSETLDQSCIRPSAARNATAIDDPVRRYARMFRMSRAAWLRLQPALRSMDFDEQGRCVVLERLWHTGRKSMRDLLAMAGLPADQREAVIGAIERGKPAPWDGRKVGVLRADAPVQKFDAMAATAQAAMLALEPYREFSEVAAAMAALDRLFVRTMERSPSPSR